MVVVIMLVIVLVVRDGPDCDDASAWYSCNTVVSGCDGGDGYDYIEIYHGSNYCYGVESYADVFMVVIYVARSDGAMIAVCVIAVL